MCVRVGVHLHLPAHPQNADDYTNLNLVSLAARSCKLEPSKDQAIESTRGCRVWNWSVAWMPEVLFVGQRRDLLVLDQRVT